MPATLKDALLFLINTLFDLYLFILIIRMVLVWVRANYFDPVTQFVIKITDFIIKPIRKLIPNIGRFETASFLVILLLEFIKFYLISALYFGIPNIAGVVLLLFADTAKLFIQTFFYAILLQVIMSWVQPTSSVNYFLMQFTSPIMRPLHRIIPTVGGIDITPIPALLILQLLIILLVHPMVTAGYGALVTT